VGAQLVREVASKTSDVAGDGTTTATVLAQSISAKGVKTLPPAQPDALKRGIEKPWLLSSAFATRRQVDEGGVSASCRSCERGSVPSRRDLGQRRSGDRRHYRRGCGRLWQGGVITIEESKTMHTGLETWTVCSLTAATSALFRHRRRAPRAVLEDPNPDLRKEDQRHEGSASSARAGCPCGKPLLIIAEDVKAKRCDTRGQQAARHAERCGCEGSGLRRSSQGHPGDIAILTAQGHHGRPGISSKASSSRIWAAPSAHHRQGQHDIVDGAGKTTDIEGA